jgi:hypothetical protein
MSTKPTQPPCRLPLAVVPIVQAPDAADTRGSRDTERPTGITVIDTADVVGWALVAMGSGKPLHTLESLAAIGIIRSLLTSPGWR